MALVKPQVTESKATSAAAVEEKVVQQEEQMTTEGVVATAKEVKAEPEVETTAEVAEEAAATEVAVVSDSPKEVASISEARANSMAQFSNEMAEAGFEGMELTGMSFDRIKLHEGQFMLGSDDVELGQDFDCVIYGTRTNYIVRQSTDNDAEMFYSYDPKGQTFSDGTSAAEKLAEWLDDGYGTEEAPLDIRPYMEATVVLVNRDDEYEGTMCMLSIPPASKARLAGASAQAQMRFKALPNEVVTRCTVGKKVGEGQKAFRPWGFKVIGRYEG